MVRMSVCPVTSTSCCSYTFSSVILCTASVSPACTEVIWCGPSMLWKILRANLIGVRFNDLVVATKVARSRAVHSHSRFDRKSNGAGNMSVFSVVSIWKIFGP